MKENLFLFVLLFAKVGFYCGFGEFLIFYAVFSVAKVVGWVPTQKAQWRRWQVCMYKFPGRQLAERMSLLCTEVATQHNRNQPARNFQEVA